MDGEIVIYPPPRFGLPFIVAHVLGGRVTLVGAALDQGEANNEAKRARLEGDPKAELEKLPKVRSKARGHR